MKKITISFFCVMLLIMSFMHISAFAQSGPSLSLAADYNAQAQTITVYYRLLDFEGTESADFRLRYDTEKLELTNTETHELSRDIVMEIAEMPEEEGKIAIQFIDLYSVTEEDCEEDGSAVIATLSFKVKDTDASEVVFISTADSCNIAPDSADVSPDRATLKISLADGSTTASTHDFDFTSVDAPKGSSVAGNENLKKIIAAAVVTGVVFVAALVVIVIKYRKK